MLSRAVFQGSQRSPTTISSDKQAVPRSEESVITNLPLFLEENENPIWTREFAPPAYGRVETRLACETPVSSGSSTGDQLVQSNLAARLARRWASGSRCAQVWTAMIAFTHLGLALLAACGEERSMRETARTIPLW